jgi:hypothetical protein
LQARKSAAVRLAKREKAATLSAFILTALFHWSRSEFIARSGSSNFMTL